MSDEILYELSVKKGFDILTVANPLTPVDAPLYRYKKHKNCDEWELVDAKVSKDYMRKLLKPFLEAGEAYAEWKE